MKNAALITGLTLFLVLNSNTSHAQDDSFKAGQDAETVERGVSVGVRAGHSYGSDNVNIGYSAGHRNDAKSVQIYRVTNIGAYAGYQPDGSNNTNIGYAAGSTGEGINNSVNIGYFAGYGQSGSGILRIANNRDSTLIYGQFHASDVDENGNIVESQTPLVGINTTSPIATLHVNGSFHVDIEKDGEEIDLFHVDTDESELVFVGNSAYDKYLLASSDESSALMSNRSNFSLWVSQGLVAEDYALISVEDWADDVFAEDYALSTLDEVEKYINQFGHLPNVPSEKDITYNGYDLHEMNTLLLAKVEELTLYTIAREKDIACVKTQITEYINLEEKLLDLEEQITSLLQSK